MKDYLMTTLAFRETEFTGGNGPYLQTKDGAKYLDFFTDVGTASLGYGCEEIDKARKLSVENPPHAPNLYRYELRNSAAQAICTRMEMDKVFFCNSGAEAVEAAIKLARKHQFSLGRTGGEIWAEKGGFHGRTYGALAAGDGPPHHYHGFGKLPAGFRHFEFGGDYTLIPDNACAVLIAPVFGNGDVRPPPSGWLEGLREYTKERGILLAFDEVQSGSGRAGAPTMAQKLGIKADIICLAKGVAMGCPVGAILATEEVAEAFTPGSHFSTFGGNPLSCSYVKTMMDWLHEGNTNQVDEMGERFRTSLSSYSWAKNVRGVGLLNAFDIDIDGIDFSLACLSRGLLIGAFRRGSGPVKLTPPLNVDWGTLRDGMKIMNGAYLALKRRSE